jgi:hypothetical protein
MSENKAATVSADDSGADNTSGASIDKMMKRATLPRFSGGQMRAHLSKILPDIKRERKRREGAGRKHTYTRERFERVLARVAAGETIPEAQASEGIAASTFRDWLERADGREEESLYCRQSLMRARELHADIAFHESIDGPRRLFKIAMGEADKNAPPLDSAMVGAVKLYSDTMRWYAAKLSPDRYGEESTKPVVNVTNNNLTINGRDLSPEQRGQLRELLLSSSKVPVIDG